jgi:hypothetical protein
MSTNQYTQEGKLLNGFDYENQAWVINGKYERCGHPDSMECDCYGKLHAGETTTATKPESLLQAITQKDTQAQEKITQKAMAGQIVRII